MTWHEHLPYLTEVDPSELHNQLRCTLSIPLNKDVIEYIYG